MKKIISSLAIALTLTIGFTGISNAQDSTAAQEEVSTAAQEGSATSKTADEEKLELTFVQTLKQKYIEGDVLWMTPVLICMIIGMALSIERVVYLNLATIDTKKFLNAVDASMKAGGVDAAKELCRNTRGPIASIFYQGLDRSGEGIDMVEKSVVAYGGVQMGNLEKGLSWLQLFIALSPMLGFLGTVIGMIKAFGSLGETNDSGELANAISEALVNTAVGIATSAIAIIMYNLFTTRIDKLTYAIEEAGFSIVQTFAANNK